MIDVSPSWARLPPRGGGLPRTIVEVADRNNAYPDGIMRLLPVMDLKSGLVVRGVAGNRSEYRPIQSELAADSKPRTVADAFAKLGFQEVYVADLDAISGGAPDCRSYSEVASAGLELIVDAGLSAVDQVRRWKEFHDEGWLEAVVVASESVDDVGVLEAVLRTLGPDASIFSLDLKNGQPSTRHNGWRGKDPLDIARSVIGQGYRRLIVLDVAAVGMASGPTTLRLCQRIRDLHCDVEIISGGGVRDDADVNAFCQAGCDRILVASALHDRRLTVRSSMS